MKNILSYQELEVKNASLERRMAELEQENIALKRAAKIPVSSPRNDFVVSATSSADCSRPYLRPTASSLRRLTPQLPTALPRFRPVQRDDEGKLVIPACLEKSHFVKPTLAFSIKTGQTVVVRSWADSPDGGWPEDMWPESMVTSTVSSDPVGLCCADENGNCLCSTCKALTTAHENRDSTSSLHHRSRVNDDTFFTTHASKIPLPFKRQGEYLGQAYQVAQETLWSALRRDWTHAIPSKYIESPATIGFGMDEIESFFGSLDCPTALAGLCKKPPCVVGHAIHDIRILRNAYAHPQKRSIQELDNLMERAQFLAVTLLDEPRAFKVRRIRDRMQREAYENLIQMDAFEAFSHMIEPPSNRYPIHHELFFKSVCAELNASEYDAWQARELYGEAIVRAALHWQKVCGSPLATDLRHQARLRKKGELLALMQRKPPCDEAESQMDVAVESAGEESSEEGLSESTLLQTQQATPGSDAESQEDVAVGSAGGEKSGEGACCCVQGRVVPPVLANWVP